MGLKKVSAAKLRAAVAKLEPPEAAAARKASPPPHAQRNRARATSAAAARTPPHTPTEEVRLDVHTINNYYSCINVLLDAPWLVDNALSAL